MGHRTWIDLTLGTLSRVLSFLDCKVDTRFLNVLTQGHFFSTSSRLHIQEVFRCTAWDEVDWEAFSSTVCEA